MAGRNRPRAVGLLGLALVLVSLAQMLPALAAPGEYPMTRRYRWKPTYGWMNAQYNGPLGSPFRKVDSLFSWTEWPALLSVDAPRTPNSIGTYEHEHRFPYGVAPPTGIGPPYGNWCYGGYGTSNEFLDLPADSYYDTASPDEEEFTWGIQAWRLVEDYLYEIYFECLSRWYLSPGNPPTNSEFNLVGQIGHCHDVPPCSPFYTWADETNKLIPTRLGRAPEVQYWDGWFQNNYSMEFGPTDTFNNEFVGQGSALQRICGSGVAWHGNCYWRVRPTTPTSFAKVYFDWIAEDNAGTASLDHEFTVRCPSSVNPDPCKVQLYIRAYNSAGTEVGAEFGAWRTIPNDGSWTYAQPLLSQPWPTGTVKWRFVIQGDKGDDYSVDYNLSSWYVPR